MSMGANTGGTRRSAINVTPLIDVLLVLLIIFMVIQPITVRGLDALAPHPPRAQAADPDPRTLVVQVAAAAAGGAVYRLNGRIISLPDLAARLSAVVQQEANPVLFVQGEPGLDYAAVVAAMDSAHAAGVLRVGVVTGSTAAPR